MSLSTDANEKIFNKIKIKMARTPNAPVRLSFIIARLRSLLRPEKRPSAESISPSAKVAPVINSSAITKMKAVNSGV